MNNSGATAIARTRVSRPLRDLVDYAYEGVGLQAFANGPVLDMGCGKGADIKYLAERHLDVTGYDPNHQEYANPCVLAPANSYGLVTCTFVVNVIEDPMEYRDLWETLAVVTKPGGKVFVASRTPYEISKSLKTTQATARNFGVVTSRGTFQKGYTHTDLSFAGDRVGLTALTYLGRTSTYAGVLFRK